MRWQRRSDLNSSRPRRRIAPQSRKKHRGNPKSEGTDRNPVIHLYRSRAIANVALTFAIVRLVASSDARRANATTKERMQHVDRGLSPVYINAQPDRLRQGCNPPCLGAAAR